MGRVTIEDCLSKVSSHFDLIIVASERAKQISSGKKSEISKKGIKSHVTALREIEKSVVDVNSLRESIIYKLNNTQQVLDSLDDDSQREDSASIIEELQSSAFITGELEEIDSDELFGNSEVLNSTEENSK